MDANGSTTIAGQDSPPCHARPGEQAEFDRSWPPAPASFAAMFLDRVKKSPDAEAYRWPDPQHQDGAWISASWRQTGEVVQEIAAGLISLGIRPEDRVALAATTRVEWIQCDLGVLCAGGATTTIYPTSTSEDVQHILADSASRFAVAENTGQLAKLRAVDEAGSGGGLEKIILIDGAAPAGDDGVITLARLRELGREVLSADPDTVTRATASVTGEQLATLIYTSGTTGRPKGVRLPHRSWVYEGVTTASCGLVRPHDLAYLWLPMAHSYGKTLLATQLAVGHAAAIDGAVDHIITNLPIVKPTTMSAVPRVFEKVHAGILAAVRHEGGAKLKIFTWALGVGVEVSRLRQQGQEPSGLLALKHAVADRLVFSTVRERFGGRMEFMISGAAPLSRDIAEFLHAVGLLVLEGYGLTETSAGTFVNRKDHYEFGTVGLPFPGSEVRIADDGEILLRGPGVMDGYEHLDEATAEVLDEGWFRTGDVGEITARGALKITDRKKDLIKTSGGKYVAPQSIETRFKVLCPLASQIVVHGDGRNFISALIALDAQAVQVWSAANGTAGRPFSEIARSPEVRAVVQQAVDQLNSGLGRWETIKKFEILDRDLTVEDGDLTPSLKLKRKAVERRYSDVLDGFYKES
jgi:long-chain acyl-CoA synthetase